MRSIEALVREFPNLKGHEILALQEEDKRKDEEEYQKIHQKELDWIEDINKNGGYFRGRFGMSQHFYYNVTNARMSSGALVCDVEEIVVFFRDNIIIEKKADKFVRMDTYGFNAYQRISQKEWDNLNSYLHNIKQFWPEK
jgi:hypothetical protein